MKKILVLVALAVFAVAAMADVNVAVYQNIPNPGDASDPANYAGSLPSATFTSSGINFQINDSDSTPLHTFLNDPVFLTTANGFDPNAMTDNSELVITGTIGLNAGNNSFVVGHDDSEGGLSLPAARRGPRLALRHELSARSFHHL